MLSLKKVSQTKTADVGTVIHAYGQESTMMYMLLNGEAEISVKEKDKHSEGIALDKGRIFGGLGLVRGNVKMIEVVAKTPCTLLVTSLKKLNDFRVESPEEGTALFKDMLLLVQQFNQFLVEAIESNSDSLPEGFFQKSDFANNLAPEDEKSYCMTKKFTCPICGHLNESMVVRGTKVKMVDRGEFFMGLFENIEPLWYALVTCESCNYTARHESFEAEIKYNVPKIKEGLEVYSEKLDINYSSPRNLEQVLNGYKMYETTLDVMEVDSRMKAKAYLMTYEVLQRAGYEEEGNVYRDQAYEVYKNMFATGILDVDDLQLQQLYLILGKLHERKEEFSDAKVAFRNAKMIKGLDDDRFTQLAETYMIDLDDKMRT